MIHLPTLKNIHYVHRCTPSAAVRRRKKKSRISWERDRGLKRVPYIRDPVKNDYEARYRFHGGIM